jgi:hypothetical protein
VGQAINPDDDAAAVREFVTANAILDRRVPPTAVFDAQQLYDTGAARLAEIRRHGAGALRRSICLSGKRAAGHAILRRSIRVEWIRCAVE